MAQGNIAPKIELFQAVGAAGAVRPAKGFKQGPHSWFILRWDASLWRGCHTYLDTIIFTADFDQEANAELWLSKCLADVVRARVETRESRRMTNDQVSPLSAGGAQRAGCHQHSP
jgi:hypothetical protein